MIVAAAVLVCIVVVIWRGDANDIDKAHRLSDGSTLVLKEVVLTSSNYTYRYRSGGKLIRWLAPVLPPAIQRRLSPASGSLGWSPAKGETNLMITTVTRSAGKNASSTLGRLQMLDDQGNPYDACWGASTLGVSDVTVHCWRVQAFPRRSRSLSLRFLAVQQAGGWTNIATLRVRNPAFGDYPQWQPEPRPIEKHDGSLGVRLVEFESGLPLERDRRNGHLAARMNRLVFSFSESGEPSDQWRIQKLTFSDATGNHWSPYLDFAEQSFSWATNGTAEFFGALWPGEQAWKVRLEAVRNAGFAPEDLWEVPLALPAPRMVNTLSNSWERDGATVKLVGLASPETDHSGEFKWTAKWWGSDKSKVYSIALSMHSPVNGQRLTFVRCTDQDGQDVKLMSHQNQDSDKQAIFLRPRSSATELRLMLAVQRSRFVEFLARPDFAAYLAP